jgi:DNA-binding transcriptional LysR family regulator
MSPLAVSLQRRLKVRHLQLLVTLDDLQHLGRVAEKLHTSQPAVSRTLSEIEEAVGEKLFSRTPKGTLPLAAGEVLIRHARQALQVLRNAGEEIGVLREGLSGRLCIGTNYSSAAYLLPNALIRLTAEAPSVRVIVREATLDTLLPELVGRRLDVVVARLDRRIPGEGLEFTKLFDEPMSMVVGRSHPLTRRRRLRWADLRGHPWILPPEDNPVREGLETLFLHHGIRELAARIECGSILANTVLLNGMNAISVLPGSVAQHYERLGLLRTLPIRLPQVFGPVGLITTGRDLQPAALSVFVRCLEACLP